MARLDIIMNRLGIVIIFTVANSFLAVTENHEGENRHHHVYIVSDKKLQAVRASLKRRFLLDFNPSRKKSLYIDREHWSELRAQIHNNVQASHLAVPRRRGIFLCPCVAREGEARVIT